MSLNVSLLTNWCEAHVEGFRGPANFTKFSTGQSNPTYRIDATSGVYVLRTKPPGHLLKYAHQVDREYRVMKALHQTSVPVPQMLALATDGDSPIGRAFFVMSYLEGRIFWDPALPEHGPNDRFGLFKSMCQTLAALHDVEISAVGLQDFGKPGNYFARQTDRWSRQYLASSGSPVPDILRIIDWLNNRMPQDDGQATLVHGDYRLDNIVFAPDGPQVIGLLDWELATLGHPLADLAYQCMQWRLPSGSVMRGLGGLDRRAIGLPTEDDYVRMYCDLRGISNIGDWSFYVVFAIFRLAAILEGVVQRARAGNASNPDRARQLAGVIPELTRLALEEAEL